MRTNYGPCGGIVAPCRQPLFDYPARDALIAKLRVCQTPQDYAKLTQAVVFLRHPRMHLRSFSQDWWDYDLALLEACWTARRRVETSPLCLLPSP